MEHDDNDMLSIIRHVLAALRAKHFPKFENYCAEDWLQAFTDDPQLMKFLSTHTSLSKETLPLLGPTLVQLEDEELFGDGILTDVDHN